MSNTTQPTTTTGGAAGATAGDKIKGVFETINGSMDKLRGEALSAADAAGNQVKDHQTTSTATRETKNADTAASGDAQLNRGLANLSK